MRSPPVPPRSRLEASRHSSLRPGR
jgi:hypothetical protein